MDNQKIIRKIRGLLAIAQDEKNDEESQSAFMLAQKLMLQYGLDASELTGQSRPDERAAIQEEPVTVYKRLYWWERYLAQIISQNFRVKYFMNTKTIGKQAKRQIVFYGLVKDLELAKEMYLLAYEVLLFHSRTFVNQYYQTHAKQARNRYVTESLKTSYLRGFLSGLDERFTEQVAQLRESYELLVLIPEVVEEAYRVLSSQWGKALALQAPNVNVVEAYQEGYQTGKQIDFTKKTLKES
ncbi:DUF2786 domain-containing protein [Enterococcus sp.]|uniref:DUF2786 domain-containing protein n=1 Tax=Enterococcus sp. TaxID=35783 RepID=UPI002FC8CE7E